MHSKSLGGKSHQIPKPVKYPLQKQTSNSWAKYWWFYTAFQRTGKKITKTKRETKEAEGYYQLLLGNLKYLLKRDHFAWHLDLAGVMYTVPSEPWPKFHRLKRTKSLLPPISKSQLRTHFSDPFHPQESPENFKKFEGQKGQKVKTQYAASPPS